MKYLKSSFATLTILGIFIILSQSCNTTSTTSFGLSVDTLELADQKMQVYIDEGKLSCISTLVLKDGSVAHQSTFGFANIEEGKAVDEETIFRIYSMSKPITAAALMILFEEGKFQLDDPVAKYITEFENTKVWVEGEEVDQVEPFTIRHLLTHTAGFTYGGDPNAYVDSLYNNSKSGSMWEMATLEDLMNFIAGVPLKNQPGTKFEYSISIDVAGYLIEVLSGESFDEFLQSRLFGPLGMDDSGFEVPEEDYGRLAMIYSPDTANSELTPVTSMTNGVKKSVTLFSGGGGMVSTIGDYGRFGQMLLNGGELDGERILEESTVSMITSDQFPKTATYEEGMGYGLGGYVNLETGAYGWSGMASTDFVLDIKNNMVILSFTQYVPFMGEPYVKVFNELVQKAVVEGE